MGYVAGSGVDRLYNIFYIGPVIRLEVRYYPGYRVYFGFDGREIIVVLAGGSKGSQTRDINTAKKMWEDYLGRKNG